MSSKQTEGIRGRVVLVIADEPERDYYAHGQYSARERLRRYTLEVVSSVHDLAIPDIGDIVVLCDARHLCRISAGVKLSDADDNNLVRVTKGLVERGWNVIVAADQGISPQDLLTGRLYRAGVSLVMDYGYPGSTFSQVLEQAEQVFIECAESGDRPGVPAPWTGAGF